MAEPPNPADHGDPDETDREAIRRLEDQGETDRETIRGLEHQGALDRDTIRGLEHQGDLDRDTIRGLENQGEMDRDTIRGLRLQAEVDHELIERLLAEGELDREKIANLDTALVTSRRIGAAIGVLMASHKVTDKQAFDLMVRASQSKHRKLRDVAEDVVLTGALPIPRTPPA